MYNPASENHYSKVYSICAAVFKSIDYIQDTVYMMIPTNDWYLDLAGNKQVQLLLSFTEIHHIKWRWRFHKILIYLLEMFM